MPEQLASSGDRYVATTQPDGNPSSSSRKALLVDYVQFAIFCTYALGYSAFAAGRLPARVYYVTLGVLLIWCIGRLVIRAALGKFNVLSAAFGRDALALMYCAIILVSITLLRELDQLNRITATSITQCLYFLVPATIAIAIANTSPVKFLDWYAIVLVVRYAVYIGLAFSDSINIDGILAIDWKASYSPFESSYAHDLLALEIYLAWRGRMVWAMVAGALTVISMKRLSFILAPIILLFAKRLRRVRRPSPWALTTLFGLSMIGPYAVKAVYSTRVSTDLLNYGIDVNQVTTGRQDIFIIATELLPQVSGFGWLNPTLSAVVGSQFGTRWNGQLHNDTVRLLIEVGILGLIVYLAAIVFMARSSYVSLLLIGYTLFVLTTSRLITALSYWVVLFLVLALVQRWQFESRRGSGSEDLR